MQDNQTFYYETQKMLQVAYRELSVEDYQPTIHTVLERLSDRPATALELGCGVGLAAISLSDWGVEVTAIDFEPTVHQISLENQAKYAAQVNFLREDFYQFDAQSQFDLVYYLDGFGIGTDADQLKLLKRIKEWLKPEGKAYIEVYNPNHWRKADGVTLPLIEDVSHHYYYDEAAHEMIDIWKKEGTDEEYIQRLKCYLPEDFERMAKEAGFEVVSLYPEGRMDYQAMQYHPQASLADCLSYCAVIVPNN